MRSTPSADRVLGRVLDHLFPELARRAVAQRLVRMHGVAMVEPSTSWPSTLAASGRAGDARVIALNARSCAKRSIWHSKKNGCCARRCPLGTTRREAGRADAGGGALEPRVKTDYASLSFF